MQSSRRRPSSTSSLVAQRVWPRLSFTSLKRSRFEKEYRELYSLFLFALASARLRRSESSVRFGRPVNASWKAAWVLLLSAFRSVMSWICNIRWRGSPAALRATEALCNTQIGWPDLCSSASRVDRFVSSLQQLVDWTRLIALNRQDTLPLGSLVANNSCF